jgi:hypothetical protein
MVYTNRAHPSESAQASPGRHEGRLAGCPAQVRWLPVEINGSRTIQTAMFGKPADLGFTMERVARIELAPSPWNPTDWAADYLDLGPGQGQVSGQLEEFRRSSDPSF